MNATTPAQLQATITHWIHGQRTPAGAARVQAVTNPATGAVTGQVALGGAADVAAVGVPPAAADQLEQRLHNALRAIQGKRRDLGCRNARCPQLRDQRLQRGAQKLQLRRLRRCPLFDYKFMALGHNTIRGAAGVAILNAELLHAEGRL